jgi:polyphosphate kinase
LAGIQPPRATHEGLDKRTPLLERVKFLAIVASNLDEFFMKRIAGLKQQVGAGVTELSIDGRTPGSKFKSATQWLETWRTRSAILG